MAVQQNRKTPSKRNMRRSHDALVAANPNECSQLRRAASRPHHVCPACGHYDAPRRSSRRGDRTPIWTTTRPRPDAGGPRHQGGTVSP
ncbi:MAG: hypothetical protein KatS3mg118_3128 [Paracoccaceae bacterium]|nr:MAG: hypothetical protein KatS3mg118_3128 [Paracoccaceae bacterium]